MEFVPVDPTRFRDSFIGAITSRGAKNNTYKFALARFLLDHCNGPDPSTKVRYEEIGRAFFKYYWLQECKSRLRQGPEKQTPRVISIIRKRFPEPIYPQSFAEISSEKPHEIAECVKEITKRCFNDVIPRFQKTSGEERRIFYTYFAKSYHDAADNRKVDPGGGILLNPAAISFLRENYVPLYKAVMLEWIRFLERINDVPNLVRKVEGSTPGIRNQAALRGPLEEIDSICFYCSKDLRGGGTAKGKTHVDHVIPYDYIGDTEMWNAVLACSTCNCTKLDRLPQCHYVEKLIRRNRENGASNRKLRDSLARLRSADDVRWHYENAQRHGYPILENFPVQRQK